MSDSARLIISGEDEKKTPTDWSLILSIEETENIIGKLAKNKHLVNEIRIDWIGRSIISCLTVVHKVKMVLGEGVFICMLGHGLVKSNYHLIQCT
ncbi:MAG TPA: hypothetical protein VK142_10465 [Bacillota bacterium]|nr:hypothetical protein [Bacillota bacterium]